VELQNYLGVYVSRDQAAAVYLGGETGSQVLGCFSVSTAGRDDAGYPALAAMVAQGCAQRGWVFAETALAVDCSMFMQHRVHSEFADARQIGSTIRFDTEETLATDISDVALAYEVLSSSERGSQLCVFTAKQDILRQIIAAFAGHGMDPVSVEPDIRCLSRFVTDACAAADGQPRTLFGMLGRTSGYLVFSTSSNGKPKAQTPGRTFLIGGRQNRQELLGREVVVTTAMVETTDPITRICVYDTARQVDSALLGQRTGIETGEFDVSAAAGGLDVSQQCEDAVAFSIACGAGFGLSQKAEPVDFRRDFMPYLGRRRRLEKSLKFLSISIGVLLVASSFMFVLGVRFVPLADMLALIMSAPLIVTALSPALLGEPVGARRVIACLLGFAGALLVIQPGAGTMQWWSLLGIAAGTTFSFYLIITRKLAGSAPPFVTLAYTAVIGAGVMTTSLPFVWVTPAPREAALMVLIGCSAAAGHYLLIRAYERAPAVLLAPFNYTELLGATLIGFWWFGDFPNLWTWGGIAVIVVSGLYLTLGERRARA